MTREKWQKAPDTLHDKSQTSLLTEKLPKVPLSTAGGVERGRMHGGARPKVEMGGWGWVQEGSGASRGEVRGRPAEDALKVRVRLGRLPALHGPQPAHLEPTESGSRAPWK